jgi:tetratricopeptide (TPR) repeat protein
MNTEYILRLIEWLDNLVVDRKGRKLKYEEKELLKQVLTGKKLDTIKIKGLTDKYARNGFARQVWNLLSEVFGERTGKKNVCEVVNRLYLNQIVAFAAQCNRVSANPRNKLSSPAVAKGSNVAQAVKSCCMNFGDINDENFNQINIHSKPSARAPVNGLWLRQRFKVDRPRSQSAESGTSASAAAEFQLLDRTCQTDNSEENKNSSCQTDNSEENKNSSYSLQGYMKFMKSGLPLLIALGVCGGLYGLSWVANWYGVENHVAGKLPQAESGYKFAVTLNPRLAETHYNLGAVYEDQQNYPQAHAQYQKAIEGGLVAAYNNQARLYILNREYERAISLLEIAMPLVKNKDAQIRYSFLKNRGWVHLLQGRLGEAYVDLNGAIALKSDYAAAHCLLAQVLEQRGKNTSVQQEWESCLRAAQPQIPEENEWMRIAQERLKAAGSQ